MMHRLLTRSLLAEKVQSLIRILERWRNRKRENYLKDWEERELSLLVWKAPCSSLIIHKTPSLSRISNRKRVRWCMSRIRSLWRSGPKRKKTPGESSMKAPNPNVTLRVLKHSAMSKRVKKYRSCIRIRSSCLQMNKKLSIRIIRRRTLRNIFQGCQMNISLRQCPKWLIKVPQIPQNKK